MKTARRIAPALLNRLTIPCFARCCLCWHYSGNWPRRKKRRADPNGACGQQPLILPPVLLMMVAAGGAPPLFTWITVASRCLSRACVYCFPRVYCVASLVHVFLALPRV